MSFNLAKDIYIALLKESYLFKGDISFNELAKTSINAANCFYDEINKEVQSKNRDIPIYDSSMDYGDNLVKVIFEGEIRWISGIARMHHCLNRIKDKECQ